MRAFIALCLLSVFAFQVEAGPFFGRRAAGGCSSGSCSSGGCAGGQCGVSYSGYYAPSAFAPVFSSSNGCSSCATCAAGQCGNGACVNCPNGQCAVPSAKVGVSPSGRKVGDSYTENGVTYTIISITPVYQQPVFFSTFRGQQCVGGNCGK